MTAGGMTRRSLLAATAGAVAGGLARPGGVLALAAPTALAQATPELQAGTGQPPIVARRAWAQGFSHPRVAPEYGSVKLAFVHHTENPNGYSAGEVPAMLRAIFLFHRDVRGWNDIGYNFVIDRFGRIFEARAGGIDEPVIGAQAGGYNYCSTGIAVLGEYGAQRISPAARAALARLLAWKLALHGVPIEGRVTVRVNPAGAVYSRFPANARVSLPRIAGHRDADSTECPGNAFYGELSELRAICARLQGRPVRATIALASQGVPGGEARALTGSLMLLGGGVQETPVPGAPIAIQARSVSRRGEVVQERTIAEAVTNAEGKWSLPATFPGVAAGTQLWLRALCPGASGVGAAVSDPLRVSVAAPVTPPPVAPAPTPEAAVPPAP
jgi:N-acetylmuramoyl-L-alanine amidase